MKQKYSKAEHIAQIREKRKANIDVDNLFQALKNGNKAQLGKAITLVESANPDHSDSANELLKKCLAQTTKSIRIGITGVPGVGKSTFIEVFGHYLTQLGKKVAVLAVDPSSSISNGSILGDKTRMETLAKSPNAFIRPSPSGASLGGVTRKTRESILLCEAAGHDVILIETVGVGQSETLVHSMVDFFLLLKLSGAGDELQGIKRGIIEMADAIVINKADGDNKRAAALARSEFERALHLYPQKQNGWQPKVLLASSTERKGIREIWQMIEAFVQFTIANGHLQKNRVGQSKKWFLQSIDNEIKAIFFGNPSFHDAVNRTLAEMEMERLSPYHTAQELVNRFSQIKN